MGKKGLESDMVPRKLMAIAGSALSSRGPPTAERGFLSLGFLVRVRETYGSHVRWVSVSC